METYKPNSHKFKAEQKALTAEEKKVEKVVSGTAKLKKKSELGKFARIFISDDVKNVKEYIIMDVLIPTAKKAIMGAIDMALNGGNIGYNGRSSTSKVSYRNYYDARRDDRHSYNETRTRTRFDYDDIIFETRAEVEAVRDQMEEIIDRYGFVTVADFYDMADLSAPYTSNKYGWMNIRNAEPVRVRDGYILKLPKASPID